MTEDQKFNLTIDIAKSWILRTENAIDNFRKKNNHIFYIVFGSIIALAIIFGKFVNNHPNVSDAFTYFIAIPAVALAFILAFFNAAEGVILKRLATKYGLQQQEIDSLAYAVLNG